MLLHHDFVSFDSELTNQVSYSLFHLPSHVLHHQPCLRPPQKLSGPSLASRVLNWLVSFKTLSSPLVATGVHWCLARPVIPDIVCGIKTILANCSQARLKAQTRWGATVPNNQDHRVGPAARASAGLGITDKKNNHDHSLAYQHHLHLCRLVCRLVLTLCHSLSALIGCVKSHTKRQLCSVVPPTRRRQANSQLWIVNLLADVGLWGHNDGHLRTGESMNGLLDSDFILNTALFKLSSTWLWSTVEKPPRTRRSERSTFVVELCQLILLTALLLWLDAVTDTGTQARSHGRISHVVVIPLGCRGGSIHCPQQSN